MSAIPPGDAACETVRAQMDAYLSNELPAPGGREIAHHLEGCSTCQAELATRTRVRAQLQDAVRATPVPDRLEDKIRRAVRGRHARPRTGLWAVAAAAAVILCAILIGLWRAQPSPEEAILRKTAGPLAAVLNVGLRDHLQCAVFRKYSKQPVPAAQMAAELGPGFADLAPLLAAKLPADFRIIQAHHCSAGRRQYTHFIIAGSRGKLVSLILTRKQSGEWLSAGIHQAGVDRFQVAAFESQDFLDYVISDLDAEQDLRWAANLAPTVREYLAAHGNNT